MSKRKWRPQEIYYLIIAISEALNESQLSKVNVDKVEHEVKIITDYLRVSERAAWFFSLIFFYTIQDGDVPVKRLSRYLGLKLPSLYQYKDAIDELLRKKLIEVVDEEDEDFFFKCLYKVSDSVLNAVLENKSIRGVHTNDKIDIHQFLTNIYPEYINRSLQHYTLHEFVIAVDKIEKRYPYIKLPQKLKKMGLSADERAFLYVIAKKLVSEETSCNMQKLLKDFYEIGICTKKSNDFISESTSFQKNELLRIPDSGYADQISVHLTDKAKNLIFDGEVSQIKSKKKSEFLNLIKPEAIIEKQLFFNKELEANLEFFKKAISFENLPKLNARLRVNKLNANLVAIFDGPSGSGKTEATKQISKNLNYDLYIIDFTRMKSEYYSQSQKLVKKTFQDIKVICNENEKPSIFLFNEADSIFHKRKSNTLDSVVSEIENEIQNLLLEALEDVPGNAIFILTTNRFESMDDALFRRLLFKIKFDIPSKEVMKKIFKSKLSILEDNQIDELVDRFELNGGLIDNIASKITMNEIINNETPSFDQVLAFCQSETATNIIRPKVGF